MLLEETIIDLVLVFHSILQKVDHPSRKYLSTYQDLKSILTRWILSHNNIDTSNFNHVIVIESYRFKPNAICYKTKIISHFIIKTMLKLDTIPKKYKIFYNRNHV